MAFVINMSFREDVYNSRLLINRYGYEGRELGGIRLTLPHGAALNTPQPVPCIAHHSCNAEGWCTEDLRHAHTTTHPLDSLANQGGAQTNLAVPVMPREKAGMRDRRFGIAAYTVFPRAVFQSPSVALPLPLACPPTVACWDRAVAMLCPCCARAVPVLCPCGAVVFCLNPAAPHTVH